MCRDLIVINAGTITKFYFNLTFMLSWKSKGRVITAIFKFSLIKEVCLWTFCTFGDCREDPFKQLQLAFNLWTFTFLRTCNPCNCYHLKKSTCFILCRASKETCLWNMWTELKVCVIICVSKILATDRRSRRQTAYGQFS